MVAALGELWFTDLATFSLLFVGNFDVASGGGGLRPPPDTLVMVNDSNDMGYLEILIPLVTFWSAFPRLLLGGGGA